MNQNALIEAGKEIARNAIMGVIPTLLAGINIQTGGITIDYRVVGAVVLVTILTGLDKYLHVSGKDNASKVEKGQSFGLVRL